jgi:ribosome biogenesis GTPase / thiamine phosphate phosphatase
VHTAPPQDPYGLTRYGWNAAVADAFAPYAEQGLLPARILRVDRGRCEAVTPRGTLRAEITPVETHDPAHYLCTGDWAGVGVDAKGAFQVRALLPRRTAFYRGVSSKRSQGQVLAANADRALIAVSLAVELDLGRIERFTTLAWSGGIEPLVVLTKADLVDDPETLAHLLDDVTASAPGVGVGSVSALTGRGLDALRTDLADGTTVLVGQSGAGKSTLANALLGEDRQQVRAARDSDGKGRHTTTTRDLLPLPGGGVLIDTPGVRGVALWDAGDGVGRAFAEIEDLAEECRFHDCGHHGEPGCAVVAAIEAGSLPARRLESYRKLLRENERLAARTDARLRAEQKRISKARQAAGRHMTEAKRGAARRR